MFIGPSDLSITLSNGKTLDAFSKQVYEVVDRVAATANKASKIAAAYTANAERANDHARRGYPLIAVTSDQGFFKAGVTAALNALKR